MIDWSSPQGQGRWKEDTSAFLFGLDPWICLPVLESSKAVYCSVEYGPYFGNSDLGIHGEPMNGKDNGYCRTGKSYNVSPDISGLSSELTGTSGKFTCHEIEVFKI